MKDDATPGSSELLGYEAATDADRRAYGPPVRLAVLGVCSAVLAAGLA